MEAEILKLVTKPRPKRAKKVERIIRVVSRFRGCKFDKSKFPDAASICANDCGHESHLITLEKGKIVGLKSCSTYHYAKSRFRELLEEYSKKGEITAQSIDEFSVLTEKQ